MHEPSREQASVLAEESARLAIIAGPGSGKTTTLVRRIGLDINRGHASARTAVITFTNAAASHLKDKLAADGVPLPGFVGTLHAWALAYLRSVGNKRLAVADEETANEVLKMCIEALRLKKTNVSKAREALGTAAHTTDMEPSTALLVGVYEKKLAMWGLTDYDLLLRQAHEHLATGAWDCGVGHLYVDEYQDSGDIDAAIYRLMGYNTAFVVGDPDQSIYSFRGGNPAHLLSFTREAGVRTLFLEDNYRCGVEICRAANNLMGHQHDRVKKHTVPVRREPEAESLVQGHVQAWECETDAAEIEYLARRLKLSTRAWRDKAVLVRYNHDRKAITEGLKKHCIPVAGEGEQTPGWDKLMVLVQALAAPSPLTFAAFDKLMKGRPITEGLKLYGEGADPPLYIAPTMGWTALYSACATVGIPAEAISRLNSFRQPHVELDLQALLLWIRETGKPQANEDAVVVTTYHGAKGREWPEVLMPCMSAVALAAKDVDALAEERRLVFVGITRAMDCLVMSWPMVRTNPYSKRVEKTGGPSIFIAETEA